jgi:outer membrane protein assembly factor BamB
LCPVRWEQIMIIRLGLGILVVVSFLSAENWPGFRGPSRQGISTDKELPTTWSATENIAWKTEIPGHGWSSPIVWGDRIFLTTATEEGASAHVIAIDRKSGKILWDNEVLRQETRSKRERNSYATPTPVTDGKRVYAVFGDGSLAALDFDGKVLWTYREVQHHSEHGLGASPVLYKDMLIMTYDGSAVNAEKVGWKIPWDGALLLALDAATGKVRWRGKRGKSRLGHVTANVVEVGGRDQLISAAGDVIQGFEITTGERIWSVYAQGEGVVPSVVAGGGLVYTSSGFEKSTILAVRPVASGEAEIAWTQTKGVPRIPSFLYRKPYLYTVSEAGIGMCLKAESGEIVWQQRIDGKQSASPLWANGLIYFMSDDGDTTVIKEGPEFEIVSKNSIGEPAQASLAASDGQIFLRSTTSLYAIGQ